LPVVVVMVVVVVVAAAAAVAAAVGQVRAMAGVPGLLPERFAEVTRLCKVSL
jgi:hypothetical protein